VRVEPASVHDINGIRAAYAHGREMQRRVGSPTWPEFTDDAILAEIDAGHLFRVVDGDTFAGVFSVAHADPAIWGDLERGDHVYLHRIARAPEWTGRGLVDAILPWAAEHGRTRAKIGIRIDTWASNADLIAFYQRRGFILVGHTRLGADPRLLPHYHGNEFALLERSCAGDRSG
jgi:GNAT superfamily N-acetyltransferase